MFEGGFSFMVFVVLGALGVLVIDCGLYKIAKRDLVSMAWYMGKSKEK